MAGRSFHLPRFVADHEVVSDLDAGKNLYASDGEQRSLINDLNPKNQHELSRFSYHDATTKH